MKIYLSEKDKKISGVCGGIAEALHVDSSMVRLCTVILAAATGIFPTVFAYIVAAMVIPKREHHTHQTHTDSDGSNA